MPWSRRCAGVRNLDCRVPDAFLLRSLEAIRTKVFGPLCYVIPAHLVEHHQHNKLANWLACSGVDALSGVGIELGLASVFRRGLGLDLFVGEVGANREASDHDEPCDCECGAWHDI